MREIKFRAWDTLNNKYFKNTHKAYKGDLDILQIGLNGRLQLITSLERRDESLFPDRFIIQQYTGLKDKNGTEIYEGDIVENASKDLKFQVVYEAPSFNRKWIDDTSKRYREHLTEPLAWNTYIICEVIGNIYENPELLGDSQ